MGRLSAHAQGADVGRTAAGPEMHVAAACHACLRVGVIVVERQADAHVAQAYGLAALVAEGVAFAQFAVLQLPPYVQRYVAQPVDGQRAVRRGGVCARPAQDLCLPVSLQGGKPQAPLPFWPYPGILRTVCGNEPRHLLHVSSDAELAQAARRRVVLYEQVARRGVGRKDRQQQRDGCRAQERGCLPKGPANGAKASSYGNRASFYGAKARSRGTKALGGMALKRTGGHKVGIG